MTHHRGFERLVNLSDAVVAIAITLLVLPLVDVAGDLEGGDVGTLLSDNADKLLAFVLSFVVIARFWVVHQDIHRDLRGYTAPMVWVNFAWLLGIVFLPFPTELVGNGPGTHSAVPVLYIGTLFFTSAAAAGLRWIAVRNPDLQVDEVRGSMSARGAAISVVEMAIPLALAIIVPSIGMWALLSLLVTSLAQRVLRGRGPHASAA